MDLEQIATIGSLFIGVLGFLFGIYTHFSTRKVAKLRYEIVQLTDFGLPDTFLEPLAAMPVMLTVYSVGNKKAENVNVQLDLSAKVVNWNLESDEPCEKTIDGQRVQILVPSLNPQEFLRISLQCEKVDALTSYVQRIKVTHSDGIGVDIKALEVQRQKLLEVFLEALKSSLLFPFL